MAEMQHTAAARAAAARLLALDTASGQCSVALLVGDRLMTRAVATARDHARLLLPMVDAVLADAGLRLRQLDGIAFGRGPGSFTGLRIAAAVTQGLAAGSDLPVLPVSDLRALALTARGAVEPPRGSRVLACMDARMGELYWGLFGIAAELPGEALGGERLSPPARLLEEVRHLLPAGGIIAAAAGRGLEAYPVIAAGLGIEPAHCLGQAEPSAGEIARLAACDLAAGARWLPAEAAQPVYVRDRVAQEPL